MTALIWAPHPSPEFRRPMASGLCNSFASGRPRRRRVRQRTSETRHQLEDRHRPRLAFDDDISERANTIAAAEAVAGRLADDNPCAVLLFNDSSREPRFTASPTTV